MEVRRWGRLGELLLECGKITPDNLKTALTMQKNKNEKLGKILLDMGVIEDKELYAILEKQSGIHWVDLSVQKLDPEVVSLIQWEFAAANNLIAYKKDWNYLHVAMADPMDLFVIDDLEAITNCKIVTHFASEHEISKAIASCYSKNVEDRSLYEHLLETISSAPIARIVKSIVDSAFMDEAEDIQIQSGTNHLQISFSSGGEKFDLSITKKE